jgi:hypothetical protein
MVTHVPGYNVDFSITAVPDGVHKINGVQFVRISLSVAPVANDSGEIDIRDWPREIARRMRTVRVFVGHLSQAMRPESIAMLGPYATDRHEGIREPGGNAQRDLSALVDAKATVLWRNIFSNSGFCNDQFRWLRDALAKETVGDLVASADDVRQGRVRMLGYHSHDLGVVFRAVDEAALATTLAARHAGLGVGQPGPLKDDLLASVGVDAARPGLGFWGEFHASWLDVDANAAAGDGEGAEGDGIPRPTAQEIAERVEAAVEDSRWFLQGVAEGDGGAATSQADNRTARTVPRLQAAAAFWDRRIGDVEFWARGGSPSVKRESAELGAYLREELKWFDRSWGRDDIQQPRTDGDGGIELPPDCQGDAFRLYGAIRSYPQLAKYLGLVFDVYVPLADVVCHRPVKNGRRYGVICVAPGEAGHGPGVAKSIWTTVMLKEGSPSIFTSCTRSEYFSRHPDLVLPYGLVKLNAAYEMTTTPDEGPFPQFSLDIVDVTGKTLSQRQRADEIKSVKEQGAVAEMSMRLSDQRVPGITLRDRGRLMDEMRKRRQEGSRATKDSDAIRILDVYDLVEGVRLDACLIGRHTRADTAEPDRWRSLFGRTIDIDEALIDPQFKAGPQWTRVEARNEGHFSPMTAEKGKTAEDGHIVYDLDPHDALLTWSGESLAVPSRADGEASGGSDHGAPGTLRMSEPGVLPLSIKVSVPGLPKDKSQTDMRPPPLRNGREYLFGARLRLLNGCGLTLDEARALYGSSEWGQDRPILGEPDGEVPVGSNGYRMTGFRFSRLEEIQAPDILLPDTDILVTSSDKQLATQAPGERIDVLVTRPWPPYRSPTRRYAVPARVGFDFAELAGAFDSVTAAIPPGAFDGAIRVRRHNETGEFPVARDGKIVFPDPRKETSGCLPSRGIVLVVETGNAPVPEQRFYPDPLCRRLFARFVRPRLMEDGTTRYDPVPGFGTLSQPVEFWAKGQSPTEAVPITIELVGLGKPTPEGFLGTLGTNVAEFGTFAERALVAALAPGVEVDLEIFALPDPERLVESHGSMIGALRRMREQAERSGLPVPPGLEPIRSAMLDLGKAEGTRLEQAIEKLLRQGPITGLNTFRRLRLVQPVEKPLRPPALRQDSAPHDRAPRLFAIVRSTSQEDWIKYVKAMRNQRRDPREWESDPGGATVFFAGEVECDRATTGRIWCEAAWEEHDETAVIAAEVAGPTRGTTSKERRWSFEPIVRFDRMFKIDNIRTDVDGGDVIDIVPAEREPNDKRPMPHTVSGGYAFPDGRARRLTLKLLATSRFTQFFGEDKPPEVRADPVEGERSARGRKALMKAWLDEPLGTYQRQSTEWRDKDTVRIASAEIWVPCVFRPPPPEIDRVVPVFHWAYSGSRAAGEIRVARVSSLRVYLKRPWHASGEGESLALVFWAEQQGFGPAGATPGKFVEKLGQFANYVTRWGTDPVFDSGAVENIVPIASVAGGEPTPGPPFKLFLASADPSGGGSGANSTPESVMVKIVPFAPALSPEHGDWYCDIRIDPGSAYFPFVQLGLVRYQPHAVTDHHISTPVPAWAQPMPDREGRISFVGADRRTVVVELHGIGYRGMAGRPDAMPRLRIRVMRAFTDGALPADPGGAPGWLPVLGADNKEIVHWAKDPITRGAEVWWVSRFDLPKPVPGRRYGLELEELEEHVSASENKPVHRGPMFASVIDLGP